MIWTNTGQFLDYTIWNSPECGWSLSHQDWMVPWIFHVFFTLFHGWPHVQTFINCFYSLCLHFLPINVYSFFPFSYSTWNYLLSFFLSFVLGGEDMMSWFHHWPLIHKFKHRPSSWKPNINLYVRLVWNWNFSIEFSPFSIPSSWCHAFSLLPPPSSCARGLVLVANNLYYLVLC